SRRRNLMAKLQSQAARSLVILWAALWLEATLGDLGIRGRARRVSSNGPLEESVGVVSDTGQSVKFKLQQDARVGVAAAVADVVPRDQAESPAAGAILETGELIERSMVVERVHHARIGVPTLADGPRERAFDLLDVVAPEAIAEIGDLIDAGLVLNAHIALLRAG